LLYSKKNEGLNDVAHRKRKKIKIREKFKGAPSKLFRVANQQVMNALKYSYVGYMKKRDLEVYDQKINDNKNSIRAKISVLLIPTFKSFSIICFNRSCISDLLHAYLS